jgi:hypothetical protein
MTLISTVVSNYGIIQASDSNLTGARGAAGAGRKVFTVDFASAALSIAGSYSVGGERIDSWMPTAIQAYAASTKAPTLAGLAAFLGARLSDEITGTERDFGSLIHLAGYVDLDGSAHPEFFFIRNIASIDQQTGGYIGRTERFQVTEDFWTRDYQTVETKNALRLRGSQRYFNGYPDGRIAYVGATKMLQNYLAQVWGEPQLRFRPPTSLDELAAFVDVEIRTVGAMFQSSDYDAPFIGGEVQIERILPPAGAQTL